MRHLGYLLLIPLLSLSLVACGSEGGSSSPDADGSAETSATSMLPDGKVAVEQVDSDEASFRVVSLVDSLEHPWAVDWLPDGRILITERPGRMVLVDGDEATALSNVPDVWAENQGGLLDVAVSPNYEENGWIYFSHSVFEPEQDSTGGTVLTRARLDGTSLTDVEEVYRQTPFLKPNYHFGSRISFMDDGTVLVTMGERGQRRERTVDIPTPSTSVGTIVRLNADGSVPDDNPFVGSDEGAPEVYSYGHRNQQGMAVHPETGGVWENEHGPHGGDELNYIEPGNNYGWPAVSYGDTYSTPHEEIGGTTAPGITDPVEYWDPSPALSGMAFYAGDQFPEWQDDLFMGALAHQKVLRVELNDDNEVVGQEELIRAEIGRIRDVAMGPDGFLYVLTDMPNGGLYRFEPADGSGQG